MHTKDGVQQRRAELLKVNAKSCLQFPVPDSIWLLSSFCTLHRLSFDAALFSQRYPQELSLEDLRPPPGNWVCGYGILPADCQLRWPDICLWPFASTEIAAQLGR